MRAKNSKIAHCVVVCMFVFRGICLQDVYFGTMYIHTGCRSNTLFDPLSHVRIILEEALKESIDFLL